MQPPKTQGALVYVGAVRPKGFFGIDRRLWYIIGIDMVFLIPASHGGLVSFLIVGGVALAVFTLGKILGRHSPYLLDEIVTYATWRIKMHGALYADDAHISFESSEHWWSKALNAIREAVQRGRH